MADKPTRRLAYTTLKQRALLLPEVAESTSYGTAALKVRGKLMVRLKEDDATVVLRTTWEVRERLLAVYPEVFFLTEHYRNHPWVLMALSGCSLPLSRPGPRVRVARRGAAGTGEATCGRCSQVAPRHVEVLNARRLLVAHQRRRDVHRSRVP